MTGPLWVIAGPTASGKTAAAISLAERLGAEIVSADSQQVYRGFDIGTAKPSAEELARVPHHLISTVDPRVRFSAKEYQRHADAAIAEIRARGKPVVVVGGTGLYLRVLLRGVVEAAPANLELRAGLEREAAEQGREALHRRLAAIDPESAAWIDKNDLVRIIRALEIHALTGQTASQWRKAHAFSEARYEHRLYVLSPPREQLYRRIDERARAMFEGGLLDEVRGLVAQGLRDAPAMESVGYVQALAAVEGRMPVAQAIAETAQMSRHYAKRQWTWFRKEPGAIELAPPYAELAAVG